MKWVSKVVIIVLLISVIAGILLVVEKNQAELKKSEEVALRNLIIKDGYVENEGKLEEFLLATEYEDSYLADRSLVIEYINTKDDTKNTIEISFVAGTVEEPKDKLPETDEEFKEIYGYYRVTRNGNTEKEKDFDAYRWRLTRQIDEEDGAVGLLFISDVLETDNVEFLCSYYLSSSNYKENYELTFTQRKDLGLYKVGEGKKYDVYTLGGNVELKLDGEENTTLIQTLFEENKIAPELLVSQIDMDEAYSVCSTKTDKETGYKEYYYEGYTVLRCPSDDQKEDLIIGRQGTIIDTLSTSKKLLHNN